MEFTLLAPIGLSCLTNFVIGCLGDAQLDIFRLSPEFLYVEDSHFFLFLVLFIGLPIQAPLIAFF